jgi:hypothetical protein
MTENRTRFRQYVRRSSFVLTLSDAQIAALDLIAASAAGSAFDWTSVNGLERRGLVEFISDNSIPASWDQPFAGRFKLTEAGRLIVGLLVEAGFIERKA